MEDGAGSATEFDGGEEEEEEEVEEEEEEEDEDELRGGEHEIVATEDGFEIGLASVGWRTRKLCRQLNLADPLVVTIASEGSLGLAIGVDKREGRIICQFITQAGLLKEIAPQVGRGDCVLALNDEVFPPFQFFDVDGDGAVARAEMQKGIEESGRELTPEQVEEIVASMDADGDGFVDIDSFTRWMSGNEVQRLMARMNDLPRPIRFTLAQKEENKVEVLDAAELAREAEPAEEPDEDVATMSTRERFHVENSTRTELSDAYKVAAKNSRAETKRAMRSLGADPILSEGSQILLELEDQHAMDVTQTYEYSTDYMVEKNAREAEEEAARVALQQARRNASAKSSAKKRDEGDEERAEEGGGKKQKRGVGRRKKRGGGDDDDSAARDGLALSALLGESRAEYDRVVAHAGYDELSSVGQQTLKEGHATGARKREERRAAALEAQAKRRAQKKREKRGDGKGTGAGGTASEAARAEGADTEGGEVRRPFPLIDDDGALRAGATEMEGAERGASASDAASSAIVAVGAACAAMAAIARDGVAAWESERDAVLRRVEASQRERRAAEDGAASSAHRIARFKTAMDGAAVRAAQSQAGGAAASAPGDHARPPPRASARVEDIEAGIFQRLGLWRGRVVEAERCPLPLLPPGPPTPRGPVAGGALSASSSRAGTSGAALRFGRQIDPRELRARSDASVRASGAGYIERLRTQRERNARSATEQQLDESAAQRFDALVVGGLTPRVHAAQRPRTAW